jgi:ATP-binding cassette subfamily B protein
MIRKYACVRQQDVVDCDAAALFTVALHYRRTIGLEQMRDLTGTDPIWTNVLGLLKAAEKLGFAAKGVKSSYDALPQASLPAIPHVTTEEDLRHFAVPHHGMKNSVMADGGWNSDSLIKKDNDQGAMASDAAKATGWARRLPY